MISPIAPEIRVAYVQFVTSVTNQAAGGKAVVMKAGVQALDRKWDYPTYQPFPDTANHDLYYSSPNKDFPFLDALPSLPFPQLFQYPYQKYNIAPYFAPAYNRQTLWDSPGAPVSDKVAEAKFTVTFDTYITIRFENSDLFKTIDFPLGKISWKYTVDASNFRMDGASLICDLGPDNSLIPVGTANLSAHAFAPNQKLVDNVASIGFPLVYV